MASTHNDSSLSSDQDTNQFLVSILYNLYLLTLTKIFYNFEFEYFETSSGFWDILP